VRGRFPVRAGFFTDFAASPFPHDDFGNNPNTANYTHVNRYGGSLSIGYRTEHTATGRRHDHLIRLGPDN